MVDPCGDDDDPDRKLSESLDETPSLGERLVVEVDAPLSRPHQLLDAASDLRVIADVGEHARHHVGRAPLRLVDMRIRRTPARTGHWPQPRKRPAILSALSRFTAWGTWE
jgi:hypothetical protein